MNVRLVCLVLALIALASTAIGGFLVRQMAKASAHQEALRESLVQTARVRNSVSVLISCSQKDARVLAGFAEIKVVLETKNERTLSEANRVLDTFAAEVSANNCYVIDRSGLTIASSNRKLRDSFVGENDAFRPYFTEAMQGRPSMHVALRATSGRRGLYCSHPVYLPDSEGPIGVVVVKSSVELLEEIMQSHPGSISLLVDKSGIVLVSTRQDWESKMLWNPSPEEMASIRSSGQFGTEPREWTGLQKKGPHQVLDSSGKPYLLEEATIRDMPQWRLFHLHRLQALSGTFAHPLMGTTGYLTILAVVLVGGAVIVLFRMGQKDIQARNRAEEALRENEERYRTFFGTSRDCVFMTRLDGRFVDFNDVTLDVLGYGPDGRDELLQKNVADVYAHPEQRNAHSELALKHEFLKEYPLDLRTKHGTVIHALVTTVARRDRNGNVIGFQGTIQDITDRKNAEDALRKSESFLNCVIDQSPYPMWISDDQGTLVRTNKAVRELLHISDDEVVGKYNILKDNIVEEQGVLPLVQNVFEQGHTVRFDMIYDTSRLKSIPLRHASFVILDVTVFPIVDADGKTTGAVIQHIDITDRKQAEQALKASEEKYRTVVEESFDGVFVQKGRVITFANARLHAMLGYDSGELEGMDHWSIYHPEYQDLTRSRAQARLRGESVTSRYELSLLRKDGSSFPGEINAKVIQFDNEPGIQVWIRDLTEQKLLEKRLVEAQKMEAIATLTGGIAHDFNNLLTVINGYTELILSEKTEDDPNYSDLQKILETGCKGAELVKRLLAFGKKAETNPEPLDLNRLIENSVHLIKRTFPKMIEIRTALANDLGMIDADASQVEQALMNLCINAQEAMPQGGRLGIETRSVLVNEDYCRFHPGAKPGRHVLVEVSDTGAGINREVMDRIFDPFFTTKGWDSNKGTGLGLSVAKGIVEQNNGWITCLSEPGKGSTLGLYFPITEAPRTAQKSASSPETVQEAKEILLVDDEEQVRELGKRILERAGYKVITATNGNEAVEIYTREQVNIGLVILDLIMPQMGGEKCLEVLLTVNPNVKVIVSSGHSLEHEERERFGSRAKCFITKPYPIKQLLEIAKDVLGTE